MVSHVTEGQGITCHWRSWYHMSLKVKVSNVTEGHGITCHWRSWYHISLKNYQRYQKKVSHCKHVIWNTLGNIKHLQFFHTYLYITFYGANDPRLL